MFAHLGINKKAVDPHVCMHLYTSDQLKMLLILPPRRPCPNPFARNGQHESFCEPSELLGTAFSDGLLLGLDGVYEYRV